MTFSFHLSYMILKDKTEEVSQKAVFENAKKKKMTDMILLQLLPREMIVQLASITFGC